MQEQSPEDQPGSIEDRIRRRAYELWEQSGQPEGSEVEFWLQAEREIARHSEANASPNSDTGQ